MQLPRGKFRSVIKGVALNSLIQELAEVRYTGVITITRNHELVTLVIQKGRYVLAEYGPLKGDAAWEAINLLGEANVDAILADFTDAGLKLATEFNGACLLSSPIITRAFRTPREKGREPAGMERPLRPSPAPMVSPLSPGIPAQGSPAPGTPTGIPATGTPEARVPPQAKDGGESPGVVPGEEPGAWAKAGQGSSAAVPATGESVGQVSGQASPAGGYDELALLHMEMSALDDVDVEHIATKIRKNAKGIVRKLHLGHIMTEKEDERGT
jgi:hypothetical protein